MLVLEATTRKTVKLANLNTESDGKQLRKLRKSQPALRSEAHQLKLYTFFV